MRYFEFDDNFPYYALIGAESEEKAIDYYKECVSDIDYEEEIPDEVQKDYAKTKFVNACKEENFNADESFEKSSEPCLFLIDGSLI